MKVAIPCGQLFASFRRSRGGLPAPNGPAEPVHSPPRASRRADCFLGMARTVFDHLGGVVQNISARRLQARLNMPGLTSRAGIGTALPWSAPNMTRPTPVEYAGERTTSTRPPLLPGTRR